MLVDIRSVYFRILTYVSISQIKNVLLTNNVITGYTGMDFKNEMFLI